MNATIRAAKGLDLAGAQPGASAVVNRVVKTLEEEHALRLNLQREANAARRIAAQMEEDAREFRSDVHLYSAQYPQVALAVQQKADTLERYAGLIRKALSREGVEELEAAHTAATYNRD